MLEFENNAEEDMEWESDKDAEESVHADYESSYDIIPEESGTSITRPCENCGIMTYIAERGLEQLDLRGRSTEEMMRIIDAHKHVNQLEYKWRKAQAATNGAEKVSYATKEACHKIIMKRPTYP